MRAALAMLLCLPTAASGTLRYTASVEPRQTVPGQKITLTITCTAGDTTDRGPSLDHKSLTIQLSRLGSSKEPRVVFPNRRTIADGKMVMREGEDTPPLELKPGEKRSRSFELTHLFSVDTLTKGEFEVGFTLFDGTREIHAVPARLIIRPPPGSAPRVQRLRSNARGSRRQSPRESLAAAAHINFSPTAGELSRVTHEGSIQAVKLPAQAIGRRFYGPGEGTS